MSCAGSQRRRDRLPRGLPISFAAAAVAGAAGASPFVLTTTLTAACAHATWNSIAHGIKDKLASFTLVSLGGMICAVPLVLLSATPSRPVWPIGLLGGGLSVLAYGLVLWAQTRGALATVAALRGGTDYRVQKLSLW
jgi:hypothetical protein